MAKGVWADPMLQWSHFSLSIWRRGGGFETTQIVHRHPTANRLCRSELKWDGLYCTQTPGECIAAVNGGILNCA